MKTQLRLGVSVLSVGLAFMGSLYAQTAPAKKAGQDRALNAASNAPMFSKRAADKVKEVRDGGDQRKGEESVLDNPKALPAPNLPAGGVGQPAASGDPNQQAAPGQQSAPPPPPPKVITWRLKGIVGSSKGGLAVVDIGGQNPIMVRAGQSIDPDSKIVSVKRSQIVVQFDGKTLNVSPW